MDFHTFITCLIAVTLLTLTPGLDTLLVIRNAARGGWQDGLASSFGICCGLFVHALVSAMGISLLLLQTAWAFGLLKLAGAGYLLWLGISSWRRVLRGSSVHLFEPKTSRGQFLLGRSLREGFLSNVLNPKAVVFYMAFLPQFIDPTRPPIPQSLLVAAMHFTVAMLWLAFLATMVDRARQLLQNRRVSAIFEGLTGTIMLYLGLRLIQEK